MGCCSSNRRRASSRSRLSAALTAASKPSVESLASRAAATATVTPDSAGTNSTARGSASTNKSHHAQLTRFERSARSSSSFSSSSTMPSSSSSPPDAKQLCTRLKAVLALQSRLALGRPWHPRDRGMLQGTLSMLYHGVEHDAREKLKADKEKKREETLAAAAEAADAKALSMMFLDPREAALALAQQKMEREQQQAHSDSSASASPSGSLTSSPRHAGAVAPAAAASIPPPLSPECSVCFTTFGTEWEGVVSVRVRASLCGHASLCAECFRTYLSQAVAEGIVLPYLRCPEPGCKRPLDHRDLAAAPMSPEQHEMFEKEYNAKRDAAIKRNEKAVERRAMRQQEALAAVAAQAGAPVAAAAAAATLTDSDEELPRRRRSRAGTEQHGSPASGRRRKSSAAVAPASGRRKSSTSAASSSSAAASDEEHDTDVVPAAPALTPAVARPPPPAPFLTNDELLRLALLHLSKVLLQCRDWVPCGTHPLGSMDAEEEGEESKEAEAADATPAPSAPAASADPTPAPAAASTESSAPASSTTASSPSSPCPFGFVVTPALQRGAATRTSDKLKKCELCGLLQIVVGKSAAAAVKHDDAMQAMIESGALRPCPQCTALNMKDYGLCNVLQCHACQIWWNWESRATGSSSQQLKDLARRTGTMWMPGELQYQQKLQREDPTAFKDLLARNGIEYNPNYIRGSR